MIRADVEGWLCFGSFVFEFVCASGLGLCAAELPDASLSPGLLFFFFAIVVIIDGAMNRQPARPERSSSGKGGLPFENLNYFTWAHQGFTRRSCFPEPTIVIGP